MENLINWKLRKELEYDYTSKWYMQQPESVWVKETREILWDFEIRMAPLIPARKLGQVLINQKKKKNCNLVDFAVDHKVEIKESWKML